MRAPPCFQLPHCSALGLLVLLFASAAQAQLVTDGATNTIDGISVNLGATNLYIGSNGPNTVLIITNGGTVSSFDSYLGVTSIASNNQVVIIGSNSIWNSERLFLGYGGSDNTILISQGGKLNSADNSFLSYSSDAHRNRIVISDANSAWNIDGDLFVGFQGSSTVIITNGGAVSNGTTYLSQISGSGGNQVVVSDANSVWNGRGFYVGFWGATNALLITNGGTLNSTFGSIGYLAGANQNRAIVTGSNSVWNGGQISLGQQGIGNTLLIADSATLNATGMFMGGMSPAARNRLTVAGGTMRVTNDTRTAELNIRDGTNVLNAGLIEADNLLLTNNVGRFDFNGGTLVTRGGIIHNNPDFLMGASAGFPDATWDVRSNATPTTVDANFTVGFAAANTTLLITNGGTLTVVANTGVGYFSASTNNHLLVSGPGSRFNTSWFHFGQSGGGNLLVVSNGAMMTCSNNSNFGSQPGVSNNVAVVTGAGSRWTNAGLYVGQFGSGSQLIVSNGGTVVANILVVGLTTASVNNRVTVDGGTLRSTNLSNLGTLDIRRGTNVLNAGLIEIDNLFLTNSAGVFQFNGGMFNIRAASVANGAAFTVGNGSSAASYRMTGLTFSTHSFANGLFISTNATFTGNGTVSGIVTVASGGMLAPGTSVGKIVLNNPPVLQGKVVMEISKNGATVTNDVVQVVGTLTYGGSLTVSNLGPSALVLSNNFPLFSATSYAGAFSDITLPALPPGLIWTNRLTTSGSIMVIGNPVPGIGGITQTGTNLILNVTNGAPSGTWKLLTATNVILPVASWTTNMSGIFDGLGGVAITNGVNAAEPKRYFRIKTP